MNSSYSQLTHTLTSTRAVRASTSRLVTGASKLSEKESKLKSTGIHDADLDADDRAITSTCNNGAHESVGSSQGTSAGTRPSTRRSQRSLFSTFSKGTRITDSSFIIPELLHSDVEIQLAATLNIASTGIIPITIIASALESANDSAELGGDDRDRCDSLTLDLSLDACINIADKRVLIRAAFGKLDDLSDDFGVLEPAFKWMVDPPNMLLGIATSSIVADAFEVDSMVANTLIIDSLGTQTNDSPLLPHPKSHEGNAAVDAAAHVYSSTVHRGIISDPEIFELEIDDSDWFEGGTSALPMDHRGATAAFLIAYAVPICACVILSLAVLGVLIYVGISLSNSANMNKPSDYRSMPISYVISQVIMGLNVTMFDPLVISIFRNTTATLLNIPMKQVEILDWKTTSTASSTTNLIITTSRITTNVATASSLIIVSKIYFEENIYALDYLADQLNVPFYNMFSKHLNASAPSIYQSLVTVELGSIVIGTQTPTVQPTISLHPTLSPTGQPTGQPTNRPTFQPSSLPTSQPTSIPTGQPTGQPTNRPTSQPTSIPTCHPTEFDWGGYLADLSAILFPYIPITSNSLNGDFCWQRTYPRGAGLLPETCGSGQELILSLCYNRCNPGYSSDGAVICYKDCPSHYVDTGLTCHYTGGLTTTSGSCFDPKFPYYHLGLCYALGVDTSNLVKVPSLSPCPDGGSDQAGTCWCLKDCLCTIWGCRRCEEVCANLIDRHYICPTGYYLSVASCYASSASMTCPSGWHSTGLLCELNVPAGFGGASALDITKGSYTRPAGVPPQCGNDLQEQNGLCYEPCGSYFRGVGPICWASSCPNRYVPCGAGCAIDTTTCNILIADQTTSVVNLVVDVLTCFAATPATKAAEVAIKAGKPVTLSKEILAALVQAKDKILKFATTMRALHVEYAAKVLLLESQLYLFWVTHGGKSFGPIKPYGHTRGNSIETQSQQWGTVDEVVTSATSYISFLRDQDPNILETEIMQKLETVFGAKIKITLLYAQLQHYFKISQAFLDHVNFAPNDPVTLFREVVEIIGSATSFMPGPVGAVSSVLGVVAAFAYNRCQ